VGRSGHSELILLFYFGFMSLQAAIDEPRRADKAGAVLALVGVVNVPIIYFSVQWWNTLHQGASVSLTKNPTMAATMLTGMLVMALAFWMYSIAASLIRVRAIILEREHNADWVRSQPKAALLGSSWGWEAMAGYVWGRTMLSPSCRGTGARALRARHRGARRGNAKNAEVTRQIRKSQRPGRKIAKQFKFSALLRFCIARRRNSID
jgi:hypothetical protein